MRKLSTLLLAFSLAFLFHSCGEDASTCFDGEMNGIETGIDCGGDCDPCGSKFIVTTNGDMLEIEGETDVDFQFTADKQYLLKGFVFVNNGATLTIEPGTIIKGQKSTKGSLIIQRGAKIMAEGTLQAPIVFTSDQPAGKRNYGDWGGLIICGRAVVNLPGGEGTVEGGTGALFGGNDNNDNSGKLKYIRIEFSGIPFQPNQEINGLTLAAVGSQTEIEFIQVSFCGDDSYEWFGGTVNAKHLIAFRGWDDDFDTDNGHSGKLQYLVALRDPAIADASASNGFESDNNPEGSSANPYTTTTFSNVSLFGPLPMKTATYNPQFNSGMHFRRNSKIRVHNTVVAGYPFGIQVQHKFTENNATNGDLRVYNSVLAGCEKYLKPADLFSAFNPETWFFTSSYNNDTLTENSELMVTDAFNLQAPNWVPMSGSPLLSGADFSHPDLQDPFFEQVNYIGAFGTTDWTTGWTNWDPQNTVY